MNGPTVAIWIAELRGGPQPEGLLGADEIARANRFHFSSDRQRFIAAHCALRQILARVLETHPGDICYQYGRHGKPSVPNSGIAFSFSHSGDLAGVAVCAEAELGIDIERATPRGNCAEAARLVFSEDEMAWFGALPPEEREIVFYQLWTCKEAYLKATGEGFHASPKTFSVSFSPAGTSLRIGSRVSERWTLRTVDIGRPGYLCALVTKGGAPRISLHRWASGAP